MDGAHRRRAATAGYGQHAPPRAPARSRSGAPRPLAPGAVGAPEDAPERLRGHHSRSRYRRLTSPPSGLATVRSPMTGFDLKHRSRALTEGPERAAARAFLKGIGYDEEALAKPLLAVAHTRIETMPCNFQRRALGAKVKEGIRQAGGTPMELNTIAISDGITMGTPGMRASLVSREVIADSIELVADAHAFDAIVVLAGCDKT